jgi:hypothetical protein
MLNLKIITPLLFLCLCLSARGQSGVSPVTGIDSGVSKLTHFPSKLFGRIQKKTAAMDQQLTRATAKYVSRIERQEARMQAKIAGVDSVSASRLFSQNTGKYNSLLQQMQQDTGKRAVALRGEYQPYVDSLNGALSFLQKNPQLLKGGSTSVTQLQGSAGQLQQLEAKMQDADQIKQFISQRKAAIGNYLASHPGIAGSLGKEYQGMNQEVYYYSQTVRQYKDMLSKPDELEQKALQVLDGLPAFQNFMKNNSQLAGLFGVPGNYGTTQGLAGLQTKTQIGEAIQKQVSSGGTGGGAALQANLQSAQSQLDGFKKKLSSLGTGSGDMDMPNFKPNDQKTKTFWNRLEYGVNFQTSRNDIYYPTVADLGVSVGYRLGNSNVIGVGASYKLGLGNGWNNIAFSNQGLGLRSFLDIKIKGSFFFSGGFEYNYTMPFSSFKQLPQLNSWTKSGLVGVSKTVSMKNRVFKNTKLSVFWDLLSYQQVPKTQPFLFRVGYNF